MFILRRRVYRRWWAIGALSLFVLHVPAVLCAVEKVIDERLKFTLILPDVFVRRDLEPSNSRTYLFVLNEPEPIDEEQVFMSIGEMAGTISGPMRDIRSPDPDAGINAFWSDWQKYHLETVVTSENAVGFEKRIYKKVTYRVEVPLEPKAISVTFFGPESRAEEMEQLLPQILAGLKGKSNWDSPVRVSSIQDFVLAGVKIAIVIIALMLLHQYTKRAPKGRGFLIAFVMFVVGWGLAKLPLNDLFGIGGAVKYLGGVLYAVGIFGMIFGAGNLILRMRQRQEQELLGDEQFADGESPDDDEVDDRE